MDEREGLERQVVNVRVRAHLLDIEGGTPVEQVLRELVAQLEEAKGVGEYTLDEFREYHRQVLADLA